MKTNEVIVAVRNILDSEHCPNKYNEQYQSLLVDAPFTINEHFYITIGFEEDGFLVSAVLRERANEKCIDELKKYLFMASSGLSRGCFDITEKGSIYFRCWVGTSWLENLPKMAVLESIAYVHINFKKREQGIDAIITGVSDAETEIKKA